MAIGDTGWAAGVQYAQDAISQAQASLAARPDFWTISLNKWIAINEAKLNKLLTPTSDEETQQLDDWAANNPEDATEWGISDSRTQPADETYIASSSGPGGVGGNLDSDFSFDDMPSETETPSGVTPTGTTPSELGDLGGGSGVTGGTSIGSIGGGGGSNGVYTPPGPTGGNTTEEPFSPPDSNGGTISTDTSGPVDDNLSGDTTDPIALEHSLTGSAAKDYLGDIAGGDIDTSELENRIRTQQVAGGLGYGGASAKQEAKIVGQYKQSERLRASEQLASLSEAESKTSTQIGQLVGQAQQDTMVASTSQLTTPVQVYESILGGSMSGLNSVFGLGGLL